MKGGSGESKYNFGKEFWAFVGRRTVSVTSTKGKLEVLQKHYEHLGRVSIDNDFYDDWKQEDDGVFTIFRESL